MKNLLYTIFSILLLMACKNHDSKTITEKKSPFCLNNHLKETTEIIEVTQQPIKEHLTLPGKIEYNENDLVAYKSLLEGYVENVNFELGDRVKQGQVLAIVKSHTIQELNQQQKSIKKKINLLEQKVLTQQELLTDGMIAAPEVLNTENELNLAKIELNRNKQSLKLYRAVGDEKFKIVAPKNGYIIQKNISKGQTLTPDSDPLFSISNINEVWVMVIIYASHLRYIKEGDEVKVRTIAYPEKLYTGKIDKVYNVFDDNEHVLKARVVLPNHNLSLMPGLSADILVSIDTKQDKALAIPHKAKIFHNNKEYIVIYTDDCDLSVKQVTTIASNDTYSYIK